MNPTLPNQPTTGFMQRRVKLPIDERAISGPAAGSPAQNMSSAQQFQLYAKGLVSVKDLIAPSAIEVDFTTLKLGEKYYRTVFVIDYEMASPAMLEPIINFEEPLDVAMYYYPINSGDIVKKLRRKIAELEASLNIDVEQGKVPDPYIKVGLQDALKQQELLAAGIEKYFHVALYITYSADNIKDLNTITENILSTLAAKEITAKVATLRMEQGFVSTLPLCADKLYLTRNMDTTSGSMTFPFISADLTQEKGVLYGINSYNKSLIVFDRFEMPNSNMTVLATSGAGKSYMVKLEAIRSLMLGTQVIIIDPEKEYEALCKAVGGSYVSFSQDGKNKINPFELSQVTEEGADELKLKELSLIGFFKIALGSVTNTELPLLDRAIRMTYREKGITYDPTTYRNEPPRLEDLYKVLKGMSEPDAGALAERLERYIVGSASGIFSERTTIDINNTFMVFSIQELSDELRPLAMYMMLDFIWTRIKRQKLRRLLIIDEAWVMLKYPDSGQFLYSVTKRARKYYLGVTVITQDVQDLLQSDYGRVIAQNSSIQILLKQHPAAIDVVGETFKLSDGEKAHLLACGVGEGLFFAGNNHVAIEVKASPHEHDLVTTNPVELEKKKAAEAATRALQENSKSISIPEGVVETAPVPLPSTQTASQITEPPIEPPSPIKIPPVPVPAQLEEPNEPLPVPPISTAPTQAPTLTQAPVNAQVPEPTIKQPAPPQPAAVGKDTGSLPQVTYPTNDTI